MTLVLQGVMLNLAHEALLTFLEHNPCDHEHPVVMDQVFGAQLKRLETKKTINGLKTRIKKSKNKIHSISGLKYVHLDLDNIHKLHELIANELFEQFTWTRVVTEQQASWKEYFHLLYDLIVVDYTSDHTGNVLLSRSIVKYHDALAEPEKLSPVDNLYPIVSSLRSLFGILKNEQIQMYRILKNVKGVIRDVQEKTTCIQHELIRLNRELAAAQEDNEKYLKILRWSTV